MALETVILRSQRVKFVCTHLISKGKCEVLKTAGCVVGQCSSSWLHVLIAEVDTMLIWKVWELTILATKNCSEVMMVC